MYHKILFCGKKTDVNNSTERQWPSPCYWDICSHDIPTSTLPLWHSLCHLISLLFFSVSPFSFIHFHPIAFHFLSTLGGEISSMVFASLLSTLSAFPCCASITSLKPPTTRIMPPPLQCCQLACVCVIMCFLSIYAPTLSFNSLLSAAGFVVHILSSLACLSAPSRQYECHVACLYSMSIIIPTTKHNSKGEREWEKLKHSGLSILSWPFYHQDQQSEPPQVVHWSHNQTAVVAQ